MSNIIPILSSSPPPIDDTPSFEDDWDNEDFGGFQGATPTGGTPGFASNIPGTNTPVHGDHQQQHQQQQQPLPQQQQQHIKNIDKPGILKSSIKLDAEDDGNWADFSGPAPPPVVDGDFVAFSSNDIQTGPSSSVNSNNNCTDEDDLSTDAAQSRSTRMGLHLHSTTDRTVAHGDGSKSPRSSSSSSGTHEERINSSGEEYNTKPHDTSSKVCKPDSQDNTSQDSVTDSGLCSDISPVPKFEEYPDFGDNKSSEVEFSDEGAPTPVTATTRASLEQDEGFANFAAVDSCGTGSDKSPDSTSQITTDSFQNSNNKTDVDPLDFRATEVEDEVMDRFGQFSCVGCESSQDLDGDAITPTQSQYDVDNLSANSPSPNPQSSSEQDKTDETVDLPSTLNTLNQNDLTTAESNGSSNTLEDIAPDHSKDAGNSDFQSSSLDANPPVSSQEGEDDISNRPTSACDSSGAETTNPASTEVSSEPSQTDASTSASAPSVASLSSQVQNSSDIPATPVASGFAFSDDEDEDEDKDDDWEFQDAVTSPSVPSSENQTQQQQSNDQNDSGDVDADDDDDDDDEEEDDFGDFASLSTTAAKTREESKDEGSAKADADDQGGDDEDDDWAFQGGSSEDFGNFASTAPGEGFAAFADSSETGGGNENWASFSEPAQVAPAGDDDDDDDDDDQFGEFDDATASSPDALSSGPSSLPSQPVNREPVETVVGRVFASSEPDGSLPPVNLLFVHMTKQILREEQVLAKQPGRHSYVKSVSVDMNVWNNLRDLEKTAALRYSWDKSSNNECLLRALTVDTRNILIGHKKSSVPIFASNLGVGVLEPCRGPPEVGREGRVSDAGVNTLATSTKLTAGTPQDIPPAEFDWSSAGLTNPLDSSNVQLDLDFFVKKTAWSGPSAYTATSPTAALENELLKAIEPEQSKQPKTLEPLENYLANLKVASTAPPTLGKESDADQLTEPAYDMVSRLPDLSFMRAKMLMFPVKGTGD